MKDETFPKHGFTVETALLWNNLWLSLKWLVYKLWSGFLMQKDVRSFEWMMQSCFCSTWTGSPIQTSIFSQCQSHPSTGSSFVLPFQIKQRTEQKSSLCFDRKHGNRCSDLSLTQRQYESWVFTVLTSLKVSSWFHHFYSSVQPELIKLSGHSFQFPLRAFKRHLFPNSTARHATPNHPSTISKDGWRYSLS